MTAIHCIDCEPCRITVARLRRPETRPRWAPIVLAGAIAGVLSYAPAPVRETPIDRLIAAAEALPQRSVEPRLTGGFRWAPLRAARRGDEREALPLDLLAAAAEIVRKSASDSSVRTRHATAIAQLLAGSPFTATAALEPHAGRMLDARMWSDLAAMRYEAAVGQADPSRLARALAAADAALRLDPVLPEAHFNRALIIERLGLRDQARDAWETYLRIDSETEWAGEARQHVRDLRPAPPFKEILEREYERLTRDAAGARAFARQYREDSRRWGETEILGRWAAAESQGDHALAARHLGLARELGGELARDRGDRMLDALVAAIDRASDSQRRDLAAAHLGFRDGQTAYRNNDPSTGERMLLDAAAAFERGGSPGALLARYFAANTAYSLGRIEESETKLRALVAETPPEFIAHRAQILWQLAVVAMSRTRWGECIDAFTESAALYERLDERVQAARMHQGLGTAYDRIGSPAEAARHRMLALRVLGQQSSVQLQSLLTNLSRTAAREEDWPTAVSIFGLAIDVARRVDNPLGEISTLLLRARMHARMNNAFAATSDLKAARSRLQRVSEPAYRSFLDANAMSVEALLAGPERAIDLLTPAIEFHRARGQRMLLPELLMERGRAFRRIGDRERAAKDFEEGVSELESRRETLAPDDRWGIFHEAEGLFDGAIALALENRDPERAFEYAERARARALLDSLGVTWPRVDTAAIPADSILVEYVANADQLVIFTVDRDGVHAVERPVRRATLAAEFAELIQAASSSDRTRLQRAGRLLHRRLIEPVAAELIGKAELVFVPDPKLGNLPFAALVDEAGRFLIEQHAIAVSPSAAALTRLSREPARIADSRMLIVTGGEDLGRLAAAEREAVDVASSYTHVTRLSGDVATPAAFARAAVNANGIHFAGHAVAGSGGAAEGYLLLNRDATADDRLDLKEISSMRLPHTDLVVLAACSTAAGEMRSTEGTISVARAFLAAGVPSVIATLWPVEDDQSAAFFPVIHRHLSRGLSPADALRAAQLEWVQKADGSVALWTAVQLIGH